MPSSLPAAMDELMIVHYGERVGVWIPEEDLGDILAGFELEKGDLRIKLAAEEVARKIAEERAAELERSQAMTQWRATWLPVIGFAVGFVSAGAIALGVAYGVR